MSSSETIGMIFGGVGIFWTLIFLGVMAFPTPREHLDLSEQVARILEAQRQLADALRGGQWVSTSEGIEFEAWSEKRCEVESMRARGTLARLRAVRG